jgi:hypothetical protein
MTQAYLAKQQVAHERVRVFHMLTSPRFNVGDFPTVAGFTSDGARDRAMTEESTADIGWVRAGREESGTARNLAPRSTTDGIPPALLAKHPELAAVEEALGQLRDGEPITAACVVCKCTLAATEMPMIGTLVVRCASGCTSFRLRHVRGR